MLNKSQLPQQLPNQLDHNRLLSLINSLTDGFLAVDGEGAIELSNSVALSLLDTNSLEGKNLKEAMPVLDTEGGVQNVLDQAKKAGSSLISRDFRLKYADGQIINLYLNVALVGTVYGDSSHNSYVILFRDITKEKAEEDERNEFISVASHELRNPVAIAEGGISNAILLAQKAQSSDTIIQSLKSAHEHVLFLGDLINDLAMVSRADRNKFMDAAAEFDPLEVLQSLQTDYSAEAQKKGLKLDLQASQLPKIFGSKLYTREVLQNFITNAIKYTEQGGITLNGKLSGDGVDLSVTDTGIGIDSFEQKRLFSKFFRSDDSRVHQINGTGLGLYVSLKLAKLMGGNIGMQSDLNQGSTFTLHLPSGPAAKPIA